MQLPDRCLLELTVVVVGGRRTRGGFKQRQASPPSLPLSRAFWVVVLLLLFVYKHIVCPFVDIGIDVQWRFSREFGTLHRVMTMVWWVGSDGGPSVSQTPSSLATLPAMLGERGDTRLGNDGMLPLRVRHLRYRPDRTRAGRVVKVRWTVWTLEADEPDGQPKPRPNQDQDTYLACPARSRTRDRRPAQKGRNNDGAGLQRCWRQSLRGRRGPFMSWNVLSAGAGCAGGMGNRRSTRSGGGGRHRAARCNPRLDPNSRAPSRAAPGTKTPATVALPPRNPSEPQPVSMRTLSARWSGRPLKRRGAGGGTRGKAGDVGGGEEKRGAPEGGGGYGLPVDPGRGCKGWGEVLLARWSRDLCKKPSRPKRDGQEK